MVIGHSSCICFLTDRIFLQTHVKFCEYLVFHICRRNLQIVRGSCADRVQGRCCSTSTDTVRLIWDGEPRTATSTFTQLMSSESMASRSVQPTVTYCGMPSRCAPTVKHQVYCAGKTYRVSLDLLANHFITNGHLATSEPESLVINLSPPRWRAMNAELKVTSAQNPDSATLNVHRNRRDY